MSIFPFLNKPATQSQQATKVIPKEYAWDIPGDEFTFRDGRFKVVEGIEAIKVWIYKALKTQRYKYMGYSWNYGNELESLVGIGGQISNNAIQSEAKRYVEEALKVNSYIKSIQDVVVTVEGDRVGIEFTIVTDFGEAIISV